MILTACHLQDLVRNFLNIIGQCLILLRGVTELSGFTPPAHKKAADFVDEGRVCGACFNLSDEWIVIVFKFDKLGAPLYHLLEGFLASAALSMFIVSPAINLSVFH